MLGNILTVVIMTLGKTAPFEMADALGKKAKNKSIQSMLGNILIVIIMTLGKTTPFERADTLGKKAKNESIQSMLEKILRNTGINQSNVRKAPMLEMKHKI